MKNNFILIGMIIVSFLFSTQLSAQNKVYTTVSGNNVYFVKGKVVLNNKGLVTQGVLGKDFPFAIPSERVIKFQAGHWVKFNSNAKVYEGFLANDHPLQATGRNSAYWFKKGTQVKFDDKGFLYEGTTAKAITMTLSNNRNVRIPAGTLVKYNAQGKVTNYNPR